MNDIALGTAGAPPGGTGERDMFSRFLQRPARVARAVFDDLVTTIFPSDCRICSEPLVRADGSPVCRSCIAVVIPQQSGLCRICGEALEVDDLRFASQFAEGLLCDPCRQVPPAFEQARAYSVYRNELREIVHLLKYERMPSLAAPLGAMLARTIAQLKHTGEEALVIAVPLFPAKERQRGYNQAALIADAAISQMKRTHPTWRLKAAHHAIRRVKDTESQFGLTPSGRRKNLRGAFAVPDSEKVRGRAVILVDDIYTTGATARGCADVLRRAGAEKVFVATVSRAQPEMVALWGAQANTAVWDAG